MKDKFKKEGKVTDGKQRLPEKNYITLKDSVQPNKGSEERKSQIAQVSENALTPSCVNMRESPSRAMA